MAKEALAGIYERGKIPLVVGGTGFYIQGLLYDIDFTREEQDKSYRERLQKKAEEEGAGAVYQMLVKVDSVSAGKIHPTM